MNRALSQRDLRIEVRDNVIQMPMDSKILAEVKPTSRHDLVPLLDHSSRQACVCMGVPPSGLGISGTHTALEAAASDGVLKSTLQRFRRAVNRCLLDVYVGLYGKHTNLTVFFPSLLNTTTARVLFQVRPTRTTKYMSITRLLNLCVHRRTISYPTMHSVNTSALSIAYQLPASWVTMFSCPPQTS